MGEAALGSPRRVLVVGTVALVVLHLYLSKDLTGPWVVPDEAGYLGNARWLVGDRTWPMPYSPLYASGYAAVLAPVMALIPDPGMQWRAVVGVNALLLAAVLPLLHRVLTRVVGVAERPALAAAAVGAVVPAVLASGFSAVSENLVLPVVLASVLAIHAAARPGRLRAQVWYGPAVACLYLAHPRFTLAIAVALAVLALGRARRSMSTVVAAVNALGLAAGVAIGIGVNRWMASSRWVEVQRAEGGWEEWEPLLTTRAGVRELVVTGAGQAWYLLAGTFGLAMIGIVAAGLAATGRGPLAAPADPADGRPVDPAARLAMVHLVATAAAVFATSVLFFSQNQFRLDHYVYGRHNDSFTPLWLGVALALLLASTNARARLLAVAVGAVPLLLTGIVVAAERDPQDFEGRASSFSVPAIIRILEVDPTDAFAVVTAVAMGGAAIAALLVASGQLRAPRLRPRVIADACLVGALVLWFVTAGVAASRSAADFDDFQYEGWSIPDDIERLDVDEIWIDASDAGSWAVLTYPFFLPDVRFPTYDGDRQQPGGPFALALVDDADRIAAGDRIALLDQRFQYSLRDAEQGLAVWVAPGPEQDLLAARGALLPPGFPTALPEEARAASVRLVAAVDGPVEVASGGRARLDVEVRHDGAEAPWPNRASFQDPGHVRVVALVTPQDPAGPPGARSGGELPAWLLPGDDVRLTAEVVAVGAFLEPLPPGRYDVELAVTQDGFDWLSGGGPDASFVLEVVPAP